MTVIEILTNRDQEITEINNNYPNFVNFIKRRYGSYESRYPEDKFIDLFISLVINNQAELAFAETLVSKTTTKLSDDQLGDIVTTTSNTDNTRSGDNVTSYQGYNVEADYSKIKNQGTSKAVSDLKSTNINYLNYLAGINQNKFSDTWKNINRQFMYLVVTIYNL